MISDIERGAKSPTVSTLSALADALAVSIAALVEAGPSSPPRLRVVRASEHVTIANPASGASRESFGPAIGPSKVEFVRYMLPARSVAGPFDAHHGGTIEHIHLAAGRLRVTLGSEAATLEAGDSCSCLADAPHAFENIDSKNDALLYLVIEGR
jgi:mannose-6-phosphate isomerase-like protein (cupin superfamily)